MILFYLLVFMAPMPNHPLFEAPLAGLTVVKWLGILCCCYGVFELVTCSRRPSFLKSWPARFFLVLFGIVTLSFFTLSKTEALTFNPMFTYFSYALLFFTTIAVVNTHERLHRTLLAAIAGEALASLYVIREFQSSGGTNLRPGYVAGDSNYFATCTVLMIPIAVYFARLKGPRVERWLCGVSVVLMLLAFTLSSSRGGLVGLCVATGYMILCSGHSRRAAIVTAVLLLPMLLLSPASPLSRMLRPSYGDFLGAQIRRDFWRAGLDMIADKPVTGIGLGNFTAQSFTVSEGIEGKQGMACNTFLEMAAELGIPGFLAYCAIVAGALFSADKLRAEGKRACDTCLQYTGQALQAGLIGFSAAAIFVSAQYQKPFWIIVALTATFPALLRQQSRRQSRGPQQVAIPRTRIAITNF